jgi:hypothetical protein
MKWVVGRGNIKLKIKKNSCIHLLIDDHHSPLLIFLSRSILYVFGALSCLWRELAKKGIIHNLTFSLLSKVDPASRGG